MRHRLLAGTAATVLAAFSLGLVPAGAATPTAGTINAFAGTGPAQLSAPQDVTTDAAGTTYIADDGNCEVRKVAADGTITRFAGTGTCGPASGIGGLAVNAQLNDALGVAVDAAGNVYVTDGANHQVDKISTKGIITVFAGTGTAGNTGNGGPAVAAELNLPWGVRVDRSGDVFISDANANVVRQVSPSGIITTVAGNGTFGYTGNGGPATSAQLDDPKGIAVDASGNLFVADELNAAVRKVNAAGIITTVAGTGTSGLSGNGGPATAAQLNDPYGVAVDNLGNLYIADFGGNCVHKVTATSGLISTDAGTCGTAGNTGNGGLASGALLNQPSAVWFDLSGNLYVADATDNTVRKITLAAPTGLGYWTAASDGGIFNYGTTAGFHGSAGSIHLNKPVVGVAASPDSKGYWLVATDGGIFNYGSAGFYGSTGSIKLNKPIVGMAATPDGKGYWLVASDGGVFNYGDAGFFGSAGSIKLNQPIVGMAATPTGQGYWLVASDGGIFNYGDAKFYGSTGSIKLNKPIVGMAATPTGVGYWLVASDGGIFNYGDAKFYGSTGAIKLNKPVVGLAATPDGLGYWLVASDGGIFNYGDANFFGSAGSIALNQPVVGLAGAA